MAVLQRERSSSSCDSPFDVYTVLTCHALFLAPADIDKEEGSITVNTITPADTASADSKPLSRGPLDAIPHDLYDSVHSIPVVADDDPALPRVTGVEIQVRDEGTGFAVLSGVGIYGGGTEGASKFLWTCQMADRGLSQISSDRQIRLDPRDFAGCNLKISYLPVRADGVEGAWTDSAWVSAADLSPPEHTIRCEHCSISTAEGIMCGRCRQAVYCTSECQVAAWRAGHNRTCQEPGTNAARPSALDGRCESPAQVAFADAAQRRESERIAGGLGEGFAV